MTHLWRFLLLLCLPLSAFAFTPVEGRDYRVLAQPQPVSSARGIEVREFFWYGCSHCFALEPHLKRWLATNPKNVQFVRTPAALNPVWEVNARGYYVAEIAGAAPAAHQALFDTIHRRQQRPFDPRSLAAFYARYGVSEGTFNSLYQSFAVNAKVEQSKALARRYQLTGVPAVVVNGRYVVTGNDQRVIDTIRYLLAKPSVPPAG